MSRNSDKLNIIDHETYQNIQKSNVAAAPKTIHNAKYKNKHKKQIQEWTLFDYVAAPRQKRVKGRNVMNHCRIVAPPKRRKGKTRLEPKANVSRLKRNIKIFRTWKENRRRQLGEEESDKLVQGVLTLSVSRASCEFLTQQVRNNMQSIKLMEMQRTEPTATTEQLTQDVATRLLQLTLNESETTVEQIDVKAEEDPVPTLKPTSTHSIHSRRFRSYCDNCTRPRLSTLTDQLLRDLDRFQKRAYAVNEIKARGHPRFVVGFRQAQSQLRINKVKLLIIATDCELCPGEAGLDATINELKSQCQTQSVPYCFPLVRRKLAFALNKRAQISCVAILDYDGANATYKELLEVLDAARAEYNKLIGAEWT